VSINRITEPWLLCRLLSTIILKLPTRHLQSHNDSPSSWTERSVSPGSMQGVIGGSASRPQTPAFPVHPRTPYVNNSSPTVTFASAAAAASSSTSSSRDASAVAATHASSTTTAPRLEPREPLGRELRQQQHQQQHQQQ
jgi:hypothetical protein